MQSTVLAYGIGAFSVIFTLIAAVLNGLRYSSREYSWAENHPLNLALVCLNAIACASLAVLILILTREIRAGRRQWNIWKKAIYFLTTFYLFATAVVTAAASASNNWHRMSETKAVPHLETEAFSISSFVFWTLAVFQQGLFCGFLLVGSTRRGMRNENDEDDEAHQTYSGSKVKDVEGAMENYHFGSSQAALSGRTVQPSSSLPVSPMGSHRSQPSTAGSELSNTYSRHSRHSISHHDSNNVLPAVNTSTPSFPSQPHPEQTEVGSVVLDHGSNKIMRARQLRVASSLDDLIKQSVPEASEDGSSSNESRNEGPITTAPRLEPPKEEENEIHPLFRPSSPSPSPIPTDGTIVIASPVAGQTITTDMARRMRSSSQLSCYRKGSSDSTIDSPSGGNETQDGQATNENVEVSVPRYILQASVRHSQQRYEKKYRSAD